MQPAQPGVSPRAATAREDAITRAVIHPAIGVARIGNSPDGWFLGPEVTHPLPHPPGFYRDGTGALKRQAARFRVYGVNASGAVVRELTGELAGVEISWTIALANEKAAWYQFQLALDILEAASAPATLLRNGTITNRAQLAIRPQAQSLAGANAAPRRFDDGTFMGKPVYLGEATTDEAGRLIVLGGLGNSASHDGSPAKTFANNDGWHDDVADGPVTARVRLDGVELEVAPAWVVVAPPNYAPQRKSVRTMWDLMRDTAIKAGILAQPGPPSFTGDILPIFERLAGLQWVNAGFAAGFGWEGAFDVSSAEAVARLADPAKQNGPVREAMARQFRNFSVDAWSPVPWPWIYGDAMDVPAAHTPRQNTALTDTQLWGLHEWAAGRFVADYEPGARPARRIEEVALAEQGEMLTRASMEFCLADAFHPGCEFTWPMRSASLYMGPFRVAHAPAGIVERDLGPELTPAAVASVGGPLYGQRPGSLTRWMAVPWQADTASCRSGYDDTYDPYVPTFWPARVPNQVLTRENYAVVMDEGRGLDARRAAFLERASWFEPLGTKGQVDEINKMIGHFDSLGVVEVREGPVDGDFPSGMEVEDQHIQVPDPVAEAAALPVSRTEHAREWRKAEKVHRFPHGLRS